MIPTLKLECQHCGRSFEVNPAHFAALGFKALPKRCPTCADEAQKRPSVVQERHLLAVYDGVEIVRLPGEWQEANDPVNDVAHYRITVRGDRFGASWSGRIDIFAPRPFGPGDVVSIREMEVKHLVRVVTTQRQTLHHGAVTIRREVPLDAEEGEKTIRSRRYLTLEAHEGPATCRLVWVTAHTKTTLKGFGRQYWAEIRGAPIAEWRVQGGYRSGRAQTTGVLAIVDEAHPLFVRVSGDIQREEVHK